MPINPNLTPLAAAELAEIRPMTLWEVHKAFRDLSAEMPMGLPVYVNDTDVASWPISSVEFVAGINGMPDRIVIS